LGNQKEVLNSFLLITKATLRTPLPLSFNQIIFGQDYSIPKIPEKNFNFQWYLGLPSATIKRHPDL
jgi:hypothetical protein